MAAVRAKMRPGSLTGLVDLFVGRRVHRYVFDRVLGMSERSLLQGAAHAAQSVVDATQSAMHGEPALLDGLEEGGLLDPVLHASLAHKVTQHRHRNGWMLNHESFQFQRIDLGGSPTLCGTRLVVGARREAAAELAGMHRLHLGSVLTVVDDQPDGLWRPSRQAALLAERGCTVQCAVSFTKEPDDATHGISNGHGRYFGAAAAPVPHFYTLEASVDGDALRDGGVADPDALRWCVVDVNGMSDHDDIGFWQAAAEVPLV